LSLQIFLKHNAPLTSISCGSLMLWEAQASKQGGWQSKFLSADVTGNVSEIINVYL